MPFKEFGLILQRGLIGQGVESLGGQDLADLQVIFAGAGHGNQVWVGGEGDIILSDTSKTLQPLQQHEDITRQDGWLAVPNHQCPWPAAVSKWVKRLVIVALVLGFIAM